MGKMTCHNIHHLAHIHLTRISGEAVHSLMLQEDHFLQWLHPEGPHLQSHHWVKEDLHLKYLITTCPHII